MKKYYNIFLFALAAILLVSCSSNDIPGDENPDKPNPKETIEIGLSFKNYTIHKTSTKSAEVRATDEKIAEAEQEVKNFYLFLFDSSGANAVKYYINSDKFTGGSWSNSDKKVTLNMPQAEAGERQVYIVANCSDIQTALSSVTTVSQLKDVIKTTAQPWSDNLDTPILMVGNKTHDFITGGRVLSSIALERALAKIELNIDLEESFQSKITIDENDLVPEYQYRFVNFDKETYVVKPEEGKDEDDLATSDWLNWPASGVTAPSGVATKLKLSTYLNERFTNVKGADDKYNGAHIEIRMNYHDGGLLPPPEFGFETYTFPTFDKVERNHKYVFDAEVSAKVEIPNP